MVGIRPKLDALFGPKKSIRAGANFFAFNSTLPGISPVPFVRWADARNLLTSNIRRGFGGRNLLLMGEQAASQLPFLELHAFFALENLLVGTCAALS